MFFLYFVCFLEGWEGEVFVVTRAFTSFILKLDVGNSIFVNIFVQD